MADRDKSSADPQPSPRPPWKPYVEKRIKEEEDSEFIHSAEVYFRIVGDLLLTPGDEHAGVSYAVQRFYEHYISGFAGENSERRPPEYGAGIAVSEIGSFAADIVDEVALTEVELDRLVNLFIGIKNGAATESNAEDPGFVYYPYGLEQAVGYRWGEVVVIDCRNTEDDRAGRTLAQAMDAWLSISTFLAKLFRAGLADKQGPYWIFADCDKTFEWDFGGDETYIGRQAELVSVANYVLIAGDAMAREVKAGARHMWIQLTAAKWKNMAEKLKEVADTVGEDARWELKSKAQRAYDRMVELYPEALEALSEEESEPRLTIWNYVAPYDVESDYD